MAPIQVFLQGYNFLQFFLKYFRVGKIYKKIEIVVQRIIFYTNFIVADPAAIEEWLHRPPDFWKFAETIDSMSLKVTCGHIPDIIRDVLPTYCTYNKHLLFQRILDANLEGKHSWTSIVQVINDAMKHYDELVNTITAGTFLLPKIIANMSRLFKFHFLKTK